ncbi:MAG: AlpA family phage regulatory protein [Pseudomonadota bacterium]|nr:AlpA family phage regulatory protein [Pseudomonadota bacterium]
MASRQGPWNTVEHPHLLRRPAVEARTGFSRSEIYCLVGLGRFPKPVKLGARPLSFA